MVMSRRPTSALENAKREAKRWLKALRDGVDEARVRLERAIADAPAVPSLRHVQLALARERGFAGWNALKDALTANKRSATLTVEHFDKIAADLVDAYRTGDIASMRNVWRNFGHMRSWESMRTYVQLDLGKRPTASGVQPEVTIDDARLLTARAHGFATWASLVEFVEGRGDDDGVAVPRPVAVFSIGAKGAKHDTIDTRDWTVALGLLGERQAPGIDARGQMTDELLERISRFDDVSSLELNGSPAVTDDGLRHLGRMRRLRHLDLGGCRISDDGLAALRDLPELRSINLAWTGVTDAGIAHLSRCPLLERVDLMHTRTGDGAVRALADNEHLRHFASGVELTDAGMALFRAFPVFQAWRGGDTQTDGNIYRPEPNSLVLRGGFTNVGLAELASLDGLYALNVDDSAMAITADGLAPLVDLPHLGSLAFDATDAAMPYIAAMRELRFLMIQDTVAGDDGFVALSRSQSIEHIWGRRCHNLRSRGFAAMASIPRLTNLGVSCLNVDDSGLAALPDFPALRELMPMDVADAGYRFVAQCRDLEVLTLMYCRETGDGATEHIATLPNLRKYFASYTRITDRTPELLSTSTSLETVEFSACAGLTNAGVATLAWLPRLREVILGGMSNVTAEIVSAFPARVRVSYSPTPTR
jgi:Leucine Rich repeat